MPSAPRPRAATWRTEPHRLLLPLGAGLATFAVLPFTARGVGGGSLALFHSVAQIQGFLTCFATALLLTRVPQVTSTSPAEGWEVAAALGLPPFAALSAWMGDAALASRIWLVLVAVVVAFVAKRAGAGAARALPAAALVWWPAALVAGAAGAAIVGGASVIPSLAAPGTWALGRGLLVQGFVTGLVLGLAGWALPRAAPGAPPSAAPADRARGRGSVALHAAAAAAFFGSFPLELAASPRLGFAVRALTAGAVLASAGIVRPRIAPGLQHRLVLLAAWLVPIAFALGALGQRYRGAALHVLFVGGFAQLALAASTDAALVPFGGGAARGWRRAVVAAMAGLLAAAFCARIAAALDVRHVARWLEIAAWSFCAAVAAWALVVGPALLTTAPLGGGRE